MAVERKLGRMNRDSIRIFREEWGEQREGEQVETVAASLVARGPRHGADDGMGAGGMAPVPPGTVERKSFSRKPPWPKYFNCKKVPQQVLVI